VPLSSLGSIVSREPYEITHTAAGALALVDVTWRPAGANEGDGVTPCSSLDIYNAGPDILWFSFRGVLYREVPKGGSLTVQRGLKHIYLGSPGGNAVAQMLLEADSYR
jgi:hypothetical protein